MARRSNGALAMKQIYDDLGLYKPLSWHSRPDRDNLAHTWNRGKRSMGELWEKITKGKEPVIAAALKDGTISSDTFNSVQNHYQSSGFWSDESGAPSYLNEQPVPKTAEEHNEEFKQKTQFHKEYIPKTVDKQVTNTWGTVTETNYYKDIDDRFTCLLYTSPSPRDS